MCDFYFAGIYWEIDGMDRRPEYFAAKYGDLPFVVVTPEDFRFRVERHLDAVHAENGDPVVSIEPVGLEMTYDVEMAPEGPLNFIANGIVSHNSHAACYALIAYRTAWLKANYPAEYMAALISSVMSTKDKVPFFVARCEEMGIEILPPDVNTSDHAFAVEAAAASEQAESAGGGARNIRFGLDAVKGVGHQAVEAIKRARAEHPFASLWDFCERVDARAVNKKAIEALIKCGAFGSTGATRKGMLEVLEQAQARGQQTQQDALIGQGSIFDLAPDRDAGGGDGAEASDGFAQLAPSAGSGAGISAPVHLPIPTEEFDQAQLLAAEKEAIGLFVSAHPLKPLRDVLRARVDCPLSALAERRDKESVRVGGIIVEAKRIRTRNGDPMMFATLDDLSGSVEVLVFGGALAEHEAALAVDEVVLVTGRVDHKEAGSTCLIAQTVERFSPSEEEIESARRRAEAKAQETTTLARPLRLRVDAAAIADGAIEELKAAIEDCPGSAEVLLDVETSTGTRRLKFGAAYRVQHTAALRAELEHALAPFASAAPSPQRAAAG
jgi:DNA polymerase-3 subunit alpha